MTPSACVWLEGRKRSSRSYYEDAIEGAVRSRDPFQKIIKGWLIRRLSPDSNPIEIADWPAKRDDEAPRSRDGVGSCQHPSRNDWSDRKRVERPSAKKVHLAPNRRQADGPSP